MVRVSLWALASATPGGVCPVCAHWTLVLSPPFPGCCLGKEVTVGTAHAEGWGVMPLSLSHFEKS